MQNIYNIAFESSALKDKLPSEKPDFKKLGFVVSNLFP